MFLLHACCLAEARSCLAALADLAKSADITAVYERLLIDLDVITGDVGPATYPIAGVSVDELVQRAVLALGCLMGCGVESVGVELLIARLHACEPGSAPGAGPGDLPV